MTGRKTISAIDVHAGGDPGRVLIGSHLLVSGNDMVERLRFCEENLDGFRRLLLQEPRGYPGLYGVLVLPPVNPGSDFGAIFLEHGGFTPMSGSNLMCAITALLETQAIPVQEPRTTLRVDTAAGVVEASAEVSAGRVRTVTITNVPAFVVSLDTVLDLPEYGKVPVDIVFGGQYSVQASAEDLGLELTLGAAQDIIRAATVLRLVAQETLPVRHPLQRDITKITLPMIHGPSTTPGVDQRSAVVMPNGDAKLGDPSTWSGTFTRSACGTGTCGRMAARHARGELEFDQPFVNESILGTTFAGSLHGLTQVGDKAAVQPRLTGRAWITGFHEFVVDDDDPFPEGFTIGDIWG